MSWGRIILLWFSPKTNTDLFFCAFIIYIFAQKMRLTLIKHFQTWLAGITLSKYVHVGGGEGLGHKIVEKENDC